MRAIKMTVSRPSSEPTGTRRITDYTDVGTVYVTYSPIRDASLDLGGAVSRTTKGYNFIAEAPTTRLTDGDLLRSDDITLQITAVYTYDNEYSRVDGVAEEVL